MSVYVGDFNRGKKGVVFQIGASPFSKVGRVTSNACNWLCGRLRLVAEASVGVAIRIRIPTLIDRQEFFEPVVGEWLVVERRHLEVAGGSVQVDRLDQVLVRLQARDRRAAGHRDLLELV